MHHKQLLASAAGIALAIGLASAASAAPSFTIDPAAVPGVASPTSVVGNYITFNADDLIMFQSTTTTASNFTEVGDAQALAIEDNNGNPVPHNGLGDTYGLWVAFTTSGKYVGTTAGTQVYNITSVDWTLYEDAGALATILPGVAATGTPPTINDNGDTLYALATGSLISGTGTVSTNGYGLNLFSTVVTEPGYTPPPLGTATTPFFVSPNPFFTIAFDSWSANPGATVAPCPGGTEICVANSNQSGQFNFEQVPEPASLTLLGGGLLGMGMVVRRRRKKAAAAT